MNNIMFILYLYKFMILIGLYICMEVLKILLSYYFIDLCHILHLPKLGPEKFINL